MCSTVTVSGCYDSEGGINITRTRYCVTLCAHNLSCSVLFSITFIQCTGIFFHVSEIIHEYEIWGQYHFNAPDVLRGVDVS